MSSGAHAGVSTSLQLARQAARQLERDYDKKTKHGETQGATFR